MRLGTIAFLLGILVHHAQAALPDRWWALGLPVVLFLGLQVPRLRLPAWALAGFLWPLAWTASGAQLQIPSALESVDLQVRGWIASIPKRTSRSTGFQFEVDSLRRANAGIPFKGRLALTWYDAPPSLRVGDEWRFTVRVKRPRGMRNPGGFDYERWLFVNGIAGRGYVRKHPAPSLLRAAARYPLQRFRQRLVESFSGLLAGNPQRGILIALAVGERQGIHDGQWEIFTRTGTAHLIAISGLHVGLMAGLAFVVVRRGWTSIPGLARRWPASRAAALAAILGAAAYSLLAGLSVPTQRALVMIAVAMLALIAQRPAVPSRTLALALLAVLAGDPAAPLSGGFWLSFGAVAAILYVLSGRIGADGPAGGWVGLQLAISLALLPASLVLFQSVSLLSPLANLIAIPWASATVVPLTLLAIPAGFASESLQAGLLNLAALAMEWLWRFLLWLADSPWALLTRPAPPLRSLAFAFPGLVLLLAPRGLPGRWLGGVLCLPLMFFPLTAPSQGTAWFTLLDVGQGLAAVVRTARHVLVYDTGPRLGSRLDAGRAALVPFLRQQGLERIDTLIVSHADNAHMGGTRSLLERLSADRVLTSSPRAIPIEGAESCRAGQAWTWDGVGFRILHPPAGAHTAGDDGSCVLLVEAPGGRVLLPGDIGPGVEAALLEAFGSLLAADVLVAPHHGTRNLSLPGFVAAVRPRYVLFSTAYKNRFRVPAPETVERYREAGATVLDTARHGAITVRLEGGTPVAQSYREQARRYWHTP